MKILSCNIEGHKHFEKRVIPFLQKEKADVVCLQEVFEVDMPRLEQVLGMPGEFRVMAVVNEVSVHQSEALGNWGVAVFSNLENTQYLSEYYVRLNEESPTFFANNNPNSMHRVVLAVSGQYQDQEYTFATTHFTWSTNGDFTKEQQDAYQKMDSVLHSLKPDLVCGDFNSPRVWSNETKTAYQDNVFARLATKYTDNIPTNVTTTIDGNLHKAGNLQLAVDGMFSSSRIKMKNVRVVDGISDHMAIVGEVDFT